MDRNFEKADQSSYRPKVGPLKSRLHRTLRKLRPVTPSPARIRERFLYHKYLRCTVQVERQKRSAKHGSNIHLECQQLDTHVPVLFCWAIQLHSVIEPPQSNHLWFAGVRILVEQRFVADHVFVDPPLSERLALDFATAMVTTDRHHAQHQTWPSGRQPSRCCSQDVLRAWVGLAAVALLDALPIHTVGRAAAWVLRGLQIVVIEATALGRLLGRAVPVAGRHVVRAVSSLCRGSATWVWSILVALELDEPRGVPAPERSCGDRNIKTIGCFQSIQKSNRRRYAPVVALTWDRPASCAQTSTNSGL